MPRSAIAVRMKFDVPLRIAWIAVIWFADRLSASARMIGTPPATAASKQMVRSAFRAASKIS